MRLWAVSIASAFVAMSIVASKPPSSMAADAPANKSAATQPTTQTSPGVYTSPKYQFTLTVPAEWQRLLKAEQAPVVLVLAEGDSAAGDRAAGGAATVVRVAYRPNIHAMLEKLVPGIEKTTAEGDPNAQMSPIAFARLGGNPAKRFSVIKKVNGIATRIMCILTVKNGKLYTLSIENDVSHDPVKDTIEKSFQFTN